AGQKRSRRTRRGAIQVDGQGHAANAVPAEQHFLFCYGMSRGGEMGETKQPQPLERRNERAPMQYRRFGKTNKALSVITLGGMRYHDGWSDPRTEPHPEMIEECKRTVLAALEHGINHIETAYGYGKSEHCYGLVLDRELKVPRNRYFLMTKGSPETAE